MRLDPRIPEDAGKRRYIQARRRFEEQHGPAIELEEHAAQRSNGRAGLARPVRDPELQTRFGHQRSYPAAIDSGLLSRATGR